MPDLEVFRKITTIFEHCITSQDMAFKANLHTLFIINGRLWILAVLSGHVCHQFVNAVVVVFAFLTVISIGLIVITDQ